MVEISKADQEVMAIVKKMYIEQHGEEEGIKKFAEYEAQVFANSVQMNEPKQINKGKINNVCHVCNGNVAPAAVEYCKDNGLKPTCYKCQEKKNINRYVKGKQQDNQEPLAH